MRDLLSVTGGKENLITSGPLLDFYNRPHPQLNRFQYWELRVIWLMLRGECFRIPIFDTSRKNGRRALKSVLILDPARFQHIVQNNRLVGWRYVDYSRNSPLSSQVFLPEEVWHEKLPNPFDFWRGMSPLAVAATAAGTDFMGNYASLRGPLGMNRVYAQVKPGPLKIEPWLESIKAGRTFATNGPLLHFELGGKGPGGEVRLEVPLVVRLEGTNVEIGKKMLAESGLNIVAADGMADAAQKIVQAVKGAN